MAKVTTIVSYIKASIEIALNKIIIKYSIRLDHGNSSFNNENDDSRMLMNSTAAAAAKRKGSFKKWLRSSHRKFTSSATNANNRANGSFKDIGHMNSTKLTLSSNTDLIENMKIKVSSSLPAYLSLLWGVSKYAIFFFTLRMLYDYNTLGLNRSIPW